MCLRRVTFKRKGLEVTPNTTRAKSVFHVIRFRWIHVIHPQKTQNVSVLLLDGYHEEGSTSAIGLTQNLVRMSRMSGVRGGPVWRQSFNAGPFSLADALYIMRSLVVDLSSLTTQ